MIIHNDNNIKTVAKFTHAYSKRLKYRCERLKGKEVLCVDIDWAIYHPKSFLCSIRIFLILQIVQILLTY